jgi:hypothetical protein
MLASKTMLLPQLILQQTDLEIICSGYFADLQKGLRIMKNDPFDMFIFCT